MKVATLTLFEGNYNYGAILQAYAMVRYINNLGHDCKTIRLVHYVDKIEKDITIKPKELKFRKGLLAIFTHYDILTAIWHIYGRISGRYEYKDVTDSQKSNEVEFLKFIHEFIPTTKLYTKDNIKEINKEYEAFVCGSDQIWKPECVNGSYFLDFCNGNNIKVAYAPSICINSLNSNEIDYYKEKLNAFDPTRVSSRELQGASLLSELLGKKIPVVADPVFLLKRDDWEELASTKKRIINEPYCLSYLLSPNAYATRNIKRFSKKNGVKMVNISYGVEPTYYQHVMADYSLNNIGPIEFLNLIMHADYVFTDSYHGCAFSIIFKKNFYVIKRRIKGKNRQMFSRFDTLKQEAGIGERLISIREIGNVTSKVLDYYPNLSEFINYSKEYLNKSLKSEASEIKANN